MTCAPSPTRLASTRWSVIGLSGGGPYTLACAAAMPDRVVAAGVLGGVAPTRGADAIAGGVMGDVGLRVAPLLQSGGRSARLGRERADPADPAGRSAGADLYGRVSPEADRRLLARPEFKAMFLDDLLNGSRKQLAAPFADVVVFARDWGFRLDEVKVPVRWWHGDRDHIVPFAHGQHVVARLPDAELYHLPGESHLGGLGVRRRSSARWSNCGIATATSDRRFRIRSRVRRAHRLRTPYPCAVSAQGRCCATDVNERIPKGDARQDIGCQARRDSSGCRQARPSACTSLAITDLQRETASVTAESVHDFEYGR